MLTPDREQFMQAAFLKLNNLFPGESFASAFPHPPKDEHTTQERIMLKRFHDFQKGTLANG